MNPLLPADEAAVDGKLFRDAMSRIGAAVHVVTTDGPAGLAGATMTAVASVTDRPPTVLVCLNRGAGANAAIKANGLFCISTLAAGDERIAETFAGRGTLHGEDRFTLGTWSVLATGAPALDGARAVLDCRLVEATEVGTHTVLFGEVVAARLGGTGPALAYLDRGYRILA
ncbi:flavin reductase [Prosthecomicrobium sp. N25]|uniref:flavin reductase n=1 Tax=Prosthecomicrobium sp. N25 TaxID=3129254 RepID=UPI003076E386